VGGGLPWEQPSLWPSLKQAMGVGCVRAVEPTFDKSPHWLQDGGLSAGGFKEAEVDKFLRNGHEQGPLEAMLERWTFGSGFQDRGPQSGGRQIPKRSPVMLHLYESRVSGFHVAPDSVAGSFHCGLEVHGREWSFSSVPACPGDSTGVFVSAPRGCVGWTYGSSVTMGTTMASQDEVLQIISVMKKEWPACCFTTWRNSYHFCHDLCLSLDVGVQIPGWVADLAAGKPPIGSQAVLLQAVAPLLCCTEKQAHESAVLEQVAVVPIDARQQY